MPIRNEKNNLQIAQNLISINKNKQYMAYIFVVVSQIMVTCSFIYVN